MFPRLLFAFLFLMGVAARSQAVFRLDSLPAAGVVLDKGWTWHLSDRPAWPKPEFDGIQWDTLNPNRGAALLAQLPQQGMGWLRIRLGVSPSLRGQPVGLFIWQMGATELFLNGHLIGQFGQIGARNEIVRGAFQQFYPAVHFTTDSIQILTIRYAFARSRLFLNRSTPFLRVQLFTQPRLLTEQKIPLDTALLNISLVGVFLILGILQLLLYFTSTHQAINLYFGLFLLAESIVHVGIAALRLIPEFFAPANVVLSMDIWGVLFSLAVTLSSIYYLVGIYQYFNQPKGLLFYLAFGITCLTLPVYFFSTSTVPNVTLGCLVPWTEILRIGLLNIRQYHLGTKLFLFAHSALLVAFTFYGLNFLFPSLEQLVGNGQYYFGFTFAMLALTISLMLAQEWATTNKLLRKQLVELDTLSQKTLAQEQERQQLLATQNEVLEQKVEARTAELNHSLIELKATQTQLIQKEKLASLGELTAGIAHEIQNPLNFVNNFSEVSQELIDEQKEALIKGDTQEAIALAADLAQNLQKIHHHGGRASRIVNGMLDHSRTNSGEKRPTDLNALAQEYLQIAYQGQRAKDSRFACQLITHFDAAVGQVNVVPQEIGRVLLNLYNNAFYAIWERVRQGLTGEYQPQVEVLTQRGHGQVVIQVGDNGTGISDSVKQKIFQPFFTTKPTGEGTGLGLSLSYDIVIKGHGGTLSMESQVGTGSVFTIHLPLPQLDKFNGHI